MKSTVTLHVCHWRVGWHVSPFLAFLSSFETQELPLMSVLFSIGPNTLCLDWCLVNWQINLYIIWQQYLPLKPLLHTCTTDARRSVPQQSWESQYKRFHPSSWKLIARSPFMRLVVIVNLQGEWGKNDDKLMQAVEAGDIEKLQAALAKKGTSAIKMDPEGRVP